MPTATLPFKEVPSVPNLRVAEVTTGAGHRMRVFVAARDSVHFVPADGTLPNVGGITIVGPQVSALEINWGKVIDIAIDIGKKLLGGDGGGGGTGGGQKCTMTTTVTTDSSGHVTGMSSQMSCSPA